LDARERQSEKTRTRVSDQDGTGLGRYQGHGELRILWNQRVGVRVGKARAGPSLGVADEQGRACLSAQQPDPNPSSRRMTRVVSVIISATEP
jgi:hypothetical protein